MALGDRIVVMSVPEDKKAGAEWKRILDSRKVHPNDSTAILTKHFSAAEKDWYALIASREAYWELMIDSLAVPFDNLVINKVVILAGLGGVDDAFTFGKETICFDLCVLEANYGDAKSEDNSSRIDRLFAHEMTHLFHKKCLKSADLELRTFRDSILWECIYEGLGTYRSLSKNWLPEGNALPAATSKALATLIPEFIINIESVCNADSLNANQKAGIRRSLSRGAILKKWGAFPVAIWIAVFTNNDAEKLKTVIQWGIDAPILLAIRNTQFNSTQLQNLIQCLKK